MNLLSNPDYLRCTCHTLLSFYITEEQCLQSRDHYCITVNTVNWLPDIEHITTEATHNTFQLLGHKGLVDKKKLVHLGTTKYNVKRLV